MSTIATQDQILIAKQKEHVFRVKVELLNQAFMPIEEVDGKVSDISFSINNDSDIRRAGSVTFVLDEGYEIPNDFEASWLDKIVRISIGIDNGEVNSGYLHEELGEFLNSWMAKHTNMWLHGNDYIYFILGSMILLDDSFTYDAETRAMSLSLVDLMAMGTSARGNQIGYQVKIPYETDIPEALAAVVSRFMKTKGTSIDEFPDVIPYDLVSNVGDYPYDILDMILSLFPYYEHYYDSEGIYHVHVIPMHIDEDVFLDKDVMDDLIISEERSSSMSNIKNSTEIWGRELVPDFVSTSCIYTVNDRTYTLGFISDMQTVEVNALYSFTPTVTNAADPKIKINVADETGTVPEIYSLYDSNGDPLAAGKLVINRTYVAMCVLDVENNTKKFLLQGEEIIHVIVREMQEEPSDSEKEADKEENGCDDILYVINPNNPYACDRNGFTISYGEIRQVFEGGDYSNIYTTDLAFQRAKYENYLKMRQNTDVTLTTVLIPFMDVNRKIEYTSPNTGNAEQYIVKSIDFNILEYTMTMQLSRFYNYYPF